VWLFAKKRIVLFFYFIFIFYRKVTERLKSTFPNVSALVCILFKATILFKGH
jgi:hypothetical protein